MFKSLGLKPVQRLIMEEIMSWAKNGIACVTQDIIAENIGVCRHTILRNLVKLEQMEYMNCPLVRRIQRRKNDGTYETTIYVFEWLQEQTRQQQQEIIENLISEQYKEYDNDNHVTKSDDILTMSFKIRELVHILAEKLELKSGQVIRCLANISYMLSEKTNIYHLDKYIIKTFERLGVRLKTEELIEKMYPAIIKMLP